MPISALAFGMPSGMEWLIILFVMLLLFGSRLPTIMRGLGSSVKEFKSGLNDGPDAVTSDADKKPADTAPKS